MTAFWGFLMAAAIRRALPLVCMFFYTPALGRVEADAGRSKELRRDNADANTTRDDATGWDGCRPGDNVALVDGAQGTCGASGKVDRMGPDCPGAAGGQDSAGAVLCLRQAGR